MRAPINNSKSGLMRYGIREMVELAQRLKQLDPQFKFIGENIGDPVAKGWHTPDFVKEILSGIIAGESDLAFGYTHSRGNLEAREWVAAESRKLAPASALDPEHVLFTNGLGAGISIFYRMLAPGARILQPNPGYPTHISSERFAAGGESIGYKLDPRRDWQPDLEHLEAQIRRHPAVAGILLINPNNPTGAVYGAEVLRQVVELAERYQLLLISDEVYFRIVFNHVRYAHITELAARRVPLVVMRGLSKDVPWPGARCGWLEFHNTGLDQDFAGYFDTFKRAVMLEVCATTMPQLALPRIYAHPQYPLWLEEYTAGLEAIGNDIHAILSAQPGLRVNRIQGAFYMTVLFEDGALNPRQSLPIAHAEVRRYIEQLTAAAEMPPDKRFAFYLLAATGICVVPATDFESPWPGFRVTTLDRDPGRRRQTYQTLARAIGQYLASA